MGECGACDNCRGETPPAPAPGSSGRQRSRGGGRSGARAASVTSPEPPTAAEEALFDRLRELRSRLAREAALPAYCIYPDRTLADLARPRPTSESDLLEVPGVGPAKASRYGPAFLQLIEGG